MQALFALTLANIRSYTRDRAAVFWTLAFPLVFIVLFGLIFQGSGSARLTIAWVDNDTSVAATQLKAGFAALRGVSLVDTTRECLEAAGLRVGTQQAGDGFDRGVDVDTGDEVLALQEGAPGGEQEVGEAGVEQRIIGVAQLVQQAAELRGSRRRETT